MTFSNFQAKQFAKAFKLAKNWKCFASIGSVLRHHRMVSSTNNSCTCMF